MGGLNLDEKEEDDGRGYRHGKCRNVRDGIVEASVFSAEQEDENTRKAIPRKHYSHRNRSELVEMLYGEKPKKRQFEEKGQGLREKQCKRHNWIFPQ